MHLPLPRQGSFWIFLFFIFYWGKLDKAVLRLCPWTSILFSQRQSSWKVNQENEGWFKMWTTYGYGGAPEYKRLLIWEDEAGGMWGWDSESVTQRCLLARAGGENEEPSVGKEEKGEEEVRRESRKNSSSEAPGQKVLRSYLSSVNLVTNHGVWRRWFMGSISPGIHAGAPWPKCLL